MSFSDALLQSGSNVNRTVAATTSSSSMPKPSVSSTSAPVVAPTPAVASTSAAASALAPSSAPASAQSFSESGYRIPKITTKFRGTLPGIGELAGMQLLKFLSIIPSFNLNPCLLFTAIAAAKKTSLSDFEKIMEQHRQPFLEYITDSSIREAPLNCHSAIVICLEGALANMSLGAARHSHDHCRGFSRLLSHIDHFAGSALAGRVAQLHVNWSPTDSAVTFVKRVNEGLNKNGLKQRQPYTLFFVGGLQSLLDEPENSSISPVVAGKEFAENLWASLTAFKTNSGYDVVYLGAGVTPDHPRSAISEKVMAWLTTLIRRSEMASGSTTPFPRVVYHDTYTPQSYHPLVLVPPPKGRKKTKGIRPPSDPVYQEPPIWMNEVLSRMECHLIWYTAVSTNARAEWLATTAEEPSSRNRDSSRSSHPARHRSSSHHRSFSRKDRDRRH